MIRAFTLSALLTLAFFVGNPVAAAQVGDCSRSWDELTSYLAKGYSEAVALTMIAANGSAVHIFASPETGTWTLTVTEPGSPPCVLSAGTDFQPGLSSIPLGDAL